MIHYAQMDMSTETVMAYMAIAGLLGFFQDRILLVFESMLLRWKR